MLAWTRHGNCKYIDQLDVGLLFSNEQMYYNKNIDNPPSGNFVQKRIIEFWLGVITWHCKSCKLFKWLCLNSWRFKSYLNWRCTKYRFWHKETISFYTDECISWSGSNSDQIAVASESQAVLNSRALKQQRSTIEASLLQWPLEEKACWQLSPSISACTCRGAEGDLTDVSPH